MAERPVVVLGETHTAAEHHRWQLQILAALHGRNPNMVLGFEAFPRSVQPALDRWIRGDMGEADFLTQSRWNEVWRYDAELYLPLFHFARQNRIPMIALNIDQSLVRKVRSEGWEGVPEEEREGVSKPAPASRTYLEFLARTFARHGNGNEDTETAPPAVPDTPEFKGFVAAQLMWDRAMAEKLAEARQAGGQPLVVGIVGRGHLEYAYGIPRQLRDLGIDQGAVLLPWSTDRSCDDMKDKDGTPIADAVFGVGAPPEPLRPPKPSLGVFIENADGAVRVTRVMEESVAQSSGLAKGDLIVAAAGSPVADTEQLVTIIRRMAPGTWLPLTIRRGEELVYLTAKFPPSP